MRSASNVFLGLALALTLILLCAMWRQWQQQRDLNEVLALHLQAGLTSCE